MFKGIDTVIIRVTDIKISKDWYQEKLCFKIIYEDPENRLVVLNVNGTTSLTLWQTENNIDVHNSSSSYPIFNSINAKTDREQLIKIGVKVSELQIEDSISYFQFYDPDGNILEACQVH